MNLRIRPKLAEGYVSIIEPGEIEGINLLSVGFLTLAQGEEFKSEGSQQRETGLILLEGGCDVSCLGEKWSGLFRKNVFSEPPVGVYVPSGGEYTIVANTDKMQVLVASAPAKKKVYPVLIKQDKIMTRKIGRGSWERKAYDIIAEQVPAEKLLVGETFNPSGKWSSYPPHKHDKNNPPKETVLEEVYVFKINPKQGFAIQRIYSGEGDIDDAYVIKNNDVMAIPRGYHPVVAAPGYSVYYLWILAGEKREMLIKEDPDHSWIKGEN